MVCTCDCWRTERTPFVWVIVDLMPLSFFFFFFNDTATTEIYTLSLHDALPISRPLIRPAWLGRASPTRRAGRRRSEEHTSELQSQSNLVCRLLLEKKKNGLVQVNPEQYLPTHRSAFPGAPLPLSPC